MTTPRVTALDADTVTSLCCQLTQRLHLPTRTTWATTLWRVIDFTGAAVVRIAAILIGLTLIGAGSE